MMPVLLIGIVVLYLMICIVVGLHKYRINKDIARIHFLGRGYFSNTNVMFLVNSSQSIW
ncbi:hypothetical protein MHYMCMPSP_00307 [Hyalomma marginatum]|uniref:Uncharacterized protein n=1 Tax=Hyalomma marginatum TaxID=34627 RepID=A0A8S4C2E5_9ACAR|nr:hypothetical protein MHYMCMPSP_00307 [Hyalomma marginatum]CAG7596715.1 hypothetical protein MHYMCMPASI_00884 [Hyalomma marginatum]